MWRYFERHLNTEHAIKVYDNFESNQGVINRISRPEVKVFLGMKNNKTLGLDGIS